MIGRDPALRSAQFAITKPHMCRNAYVHLSLFPRLIVGAPRDTAANSAVQNTGLVYTCPLTPGSCSGLTGSGEGRRLFDDAGEFRRLYCL